MNRNIYTIRHSYQKHMVHYYLAPNRSNKEGTICNGFKYYSQKIVRIMYPKTLYNPNYVYARNTYGYLET